MFLAPSVRCWQEVCHADFRKLSGNERFAGDFEFIWCRFARRFLADRRVIREEAISRLGSIHIHTVLASAWSLKVGHPVDCDLVSSAE